MLNLPHRPRLRPGRGCGGQERQQRKSDGSGHRGQQELRLHTSGDGGDQGQATGERQGDAALPEPPQLGGSPSAGDDPEDGQETIYGSKPNQFIIRPIAPHQHQQHESHQEPQLRDFAAANSRPHAAQLLEQSQEVSWGRNKRVYG